jgi:hypothetical protein
LRPGGSAERLRATIRPKSSSNSAALYTYAAGGRLQRARSQIETLRYAEPISGYIITELNDTQWEANGIIDSRNNPRRYGERLAQIQKDWLIIARPARTSVRSAEAFSLPVRLASANRLDRSARLTWVFGEARGAVALPPGPTGSAEVSLVDPAVDTIQLRDRRCLAAQGGRAHQADLSSARAGLLHRPLTSLERLARRILWPLIS